MKTGDRVKRSGYALAPDREAMVKWVSWSSQHAAAKDAYDKAAARRGTVLGVTVNRFKSEDVHVKWDDGSESHSLPYMLEVTP